MSPYHHVALTDRKRTLRRSAIVLMLLVLVIAVGLAIQSYRPPTSVETLPPHRVRGFYVFHPVLPSHEVTRLTKDKRASYLAIDLWSLKYTPLPAVQLMAPDGSWAVMQGLGGKRLLVLAEGDQHSIPLSYPLFARKYRPLDPGQVNANGLIGDVEYTKQGSGYRCFFRITDPRSGISRRHAFPRVPIDAMGGYMNPMTDGLVAETAKDMILRIDFEADRLTELGRGHWPCVSADGDVAFTTMNEKHITIVSEDGQTSLHRGPGRRVSWLQWTPDGRCLLYNTYSDRSWRARMGTISSDSWVVGVYEVGTGRHYRVVPAVYNGLQVYRANRHGMGQCLSALPARLVDRLWQTQHEDAAAGMLWRPSK